MFRPGDLVRNKLNQKVWAWPSCVLVVGPDGRTRAKMDGPLTNDLRGMGLVLMTITDDVERGRALLVLMSAARHTCYVWSSSVLRVQ